MITIKSSSSTSDSGLNRSVELNDSDLVTVIQTSTDIVSVLKKLEIGATDGIIIKKFNTFLSGIFQASILTASTGIFPLRTDQTTKKPDIFNTTYHQQFTFGYYRDIHLTGEYSSVAQRQQ
jgi:hypothetical protein